MEYLLAIGLVLLLIAVYLATSFILNGKYPHSEYMKEELERIKEYDNRER